MTDTPPTAPAASEHELGRQEVLKRFAVRDLTASSGGREAAQQIEKARAVFSDLAETIYDTTVPSREQGRALESLELTFFYVQRALTRYGRPAETEAPGGE
jgi:hypothetical protein